MRVHSVWSGSSSIYFHKVMFLSFSFLGRFNRIGLSQFEVIFNR